MATAAATLALQAMTSLDQYTPLWATKARELRCHRKVVYGSADSLYPVGMSFF